jgi:hypothetical protein
VWSARPCCQTSDLCVAFIHVFAYFPLAIRLNDDIICLHGGIGLQFVSLGQLKTLSPPIAASTDPIVDAIVWSDPNADVADFQVNRKRNGGSKFGGRLLADFLSHRGLKTNILMTKTLSNPSNASNVWLASVYLAGNFIS